MKILGITELDNTAGACAIVDGRVVAAANEERFTRVKQHACFPRETVAWICGYLGLAPAEFDGIAIAKPTVEEELLLVRGPVRKYRWSSENRSTGLEKALSKAAFSWWRFPRHARSVRSLNAELDEWLVESGLDESRLYRVDHHRAHALSAHFASGFEDALVVTCDGQGGGVTGTVWRGRGKTLERLHAVLLPNSMGYFYAAATKALGFKPNRHEGKVTGLAAYGRPTPEDLAEIRRLAWFEGDGYRSPCVHGAYPRIRKLLASIGKERFSAAFQIVLEEVVTAWVRHWFERSGTKRISLSGGVFANVKLNQRVGEIEGVEEVFVFPGMADGGLGHGAALAWDLDKGESETPPGLEDVFWGPEPTDSECKAALDSIGWEFDRPEDLVGAVAASLAEGKVVAVCRGRMEFGPRALCNRSILYRTSDPTVNDWLNERLHRTEFMPFAPVTRIEDSSRCYPGLVSKNTARFMTITTDCSPEMKEKCPAVVHVDGTARPQLVSASDHPFVHSVLTRYLETTGLPSLINTSFNMHEEPIARTVEDSIRAARQAKFDYLVLGPYLAKVGP